MKNPKERKTSGISPIRDENGVIIAFLVRNRRNGKKLQEYVGVPSFGSVEAAYEEAEKSRDEFACKNPLRPPKANDYAKLVKKSSTGYRGVSLLSRKSKRNGQIYETYQAAWPAIDGSRPTKGFSVLLWRNDALPNAVAARKAGIKAYLSDLSRR